ncbi:GntR family transcriptional regulator [Acidisoma cellulosilytica]|uniref:GntR family transcriptional regulator n=1 Tax=Acidisoma cellulosilyticum TaxID=2802395 RepID=A0A963Z6H3_9PROT|nr:GntR family transcriptional regulator [Acidisoma cellulosilyticum]MCB8882747.1 GntR family transcriptional regulator [Acidisoma cellulosilyticum]
MVTTTRLGGAAALVYQELMADIADFRLLPGDRFTETDLSHRFGASRTPIRDALLQLKRDGFVDVRFRSGWFVCPFDFQRFDELYELRMTLEVAAFERLSRAEPEIRLAALDHLDAIWIIDESARETEPRRMTELDEGFHSGIVEAAGNREMAIIHREITEKIRIIRRLDFFKDARTAATYREHGELLRLLRRGALSEAIIMLRAHIEASKLEVRKITLHMMHEARLGATKS